MLSTYWSGAMKNKTLVVLAIATSVSLVLSETCAFGNDSVKLLSDAIQNSQEIYSIGFSPDGKLLVVAGGGEPDQAGKEVSELTIWDAKSRKKVATLPTHMGVDYSVAFSPDGKELAAGGSDMTVRLWDVASGKQLASLGELAGRIWSLAFSPDGKTLAIALWSVSDKFDGKPGVVVLWDVASRKVRKKLEGHIGHVLRVAFSPDGKTLSATAVEFDKAYGMVVRSEIRFWDPGTGKQKGSLEREGYICSTTFSPDGKTLAFGTTNERDKPDRIDFWGQVVLWSVAEPKKSRSVDAFRSEVNCLAFSADGKTLASGSWAIFEFKEGPGLNGVIVSGELVLFETRTLKPIGKSQDFSGKINSMAFSPVEGVLATTDKNTVKLWEVPTRK